jgi:hypothetical protein
MTSRAFPASTNAASESGPGSAPGSLPTAAPRGDVPAAWMTWLTTEHYNLQTQRAGTIGEANGRASIFLGALSAGLIALGFAATGDRTAGTTTFEVLVLSSLVVLGTITFLRCLQIAIDDWDFGDRIRHLRAIYADLLPDLATRLGSMTGDEQAVVMLRPVLSRLQGLLTVAGSLCVITAIVFGSDAGVLCSGLGLSLAWAITIGAAAGASFAALGVRFQTARWVGADLARRASAANADPGQVLDVSAPGQAELL